MDTHAFFLIMRNEMKLQMRSWVFRFFVVLSLVGIVACQMYRQGGDGMHWKMVGLPCSIPLVNAYLFCLVQSLFLIVVMSDFPKRLVRSGLRDGVLVRPFGNTVYYWGSLAGVFLSFMIVCLLAMFMEMLVVHSVSLSPFRLGYYLFYLLTLTIPCWVFVSGLMVFLSRYTSRLIALLAGVLWWLGSIWWLPYVSHGTFDFFAVGVPNLFSDMVGHINLSAYLHHRLIYFFAGIGFLLLGLGRLGRIPNREIRGVCSWCGLGVLVMGLGCLFLLEYRYRDDRMVRHEWKNTFEHYWNETTCRVKNHRIRLAQHDNVLEVGSDMTVYNPGRAALDSIVLFLNPGLHIRELRCGAEDLSYTRSGQVVVVHRSLPATDSLVLHWEYGGTVDDRVCDLHLSDKEYEDVFHADNFFPTGRRGAFVHRDILLLTPACMWYPVAFPPVNPLGEAFTHWDFTSFQLTVAQPSQRCVVSQGKCVRQGDSVCFSSCLSPGISVYAADVNSYSIPLHQTLKLDCYAGKWGEILKNCFGKVRRSVFSRYMKEDGKKYTGYEPEDYEAVLWDEDGNVRIACVETPVSFVPSGYRVEPVDVKVEPGMFFCPEYMFFPSYCTGSLSGDFQTYDDCSLVFDELFYTMFVSMSTVGSHPLPGMDRVVSPVARHAANLVFRLPRYRMYSGKYPFMGVVFELLRRSYGEPLHFNLEGIAHANEDGDENVYDYLMGRTLGEILSDNALDERLKYEALYVKAKELWSYFALVVPEEELAASLDSIAAVAVGEVSYDSLMAGWNRRGLSDADSLTDVWYATRHTHYFKVKDAVRYYNEQTGLYRLEAWVRNMGDCGGFFSVNYGGVFEPKSVHFYFAPHEAKYLSFCEEGIGYMYAYLSANRPIVWRGDNGHCSREMVESWKPGFVSRTISDAEFEKSDENVWLVDDTDDGFEVKNSNESWFRRKFGKKPAYRVITRSGRTSDWVPAYHTSACGDSIRGYHCIGGGVGESTATWRVALPRGYYEIWVKVFKDYIATFPGIKAFPSSVVNYYTVCYGDKQEEIELPLDEELEGLPSGWVSLGKFDFPEGEVRVILSDKEVNKDKDVAIIADAVKFVRLE